MATTPNPTTIRTQFEALLVEWETEIISDSTGVAYGFYEQGSRLYWTNHIRPAPPIKIGTNRWEHPLIVIAVLHLDPVTSGLDGEKEMATRWMLDDILHAMVDNRQMKTTTYPGGMKALDPRGIEILDTSFGVEGDVFKTIQITFSVPLGYTKS